MPLTPSPFPRPPLKHTANDRRISEIPSKRPRGRAPSAGKRPPLPPPDREGAEVLARRPRRAAGKREVTAMPVERYNPHAAESRWQKAWDDAEIFATRND